MIEQQVEMEGSATMGRYVFDLDALLEIKAACQASSGRLQEESSNMQTQLTNLEQAIQGIPGLAMAEKFEELRQFLVRLSTSLEESQSYLANVVQRAEEFAGGLQH
ncbi:MAG TPA: hypothetical protein VJR48_06350 [Ktedonobacterales bacterium]|nr:hypothetical protein [Ktedonobacterales bacterium]